MIGKTVLGCTIKEKISSDALTTVYKGEKADQQGVCVLKHISFPTRRQYLEVLSSFGGDYSKADNYFSDVIKDMSKEIQIWKKLTEQGVHNLVSCYGNQIDENKIPLRYNIYILMESVMPFPEYFAQNTLTVKDVIRLGKDILTALAVCHKNQLIHRNIKEDHIFVRADGSFQLGGFGIYKKSPEAEEEDDRHDKTTDLYSLGIILCKLLHCDGNADHELGKVIFRATLPRSDRYRSAEEFHEALCLVEDHMTNEDLDFPAADLISQNSTVSQQKDFFQDSFVEESLPKHQIEPDIQIRMTPLEQLPRAAVRRKKSFDWIFYVLPPLIVVVYVLIYVVYLPHRFSTVIHKELFFRIIKYAFYAGFTASLYFLGRKLHFSRQEYASEAGLKDQEAYDLALQAYESIRNLSPEVPKDVINAVKTVRDRLKNESDFGYGNLQIVQCETEIESMLHAIISNVAGLQNENTSDLSGQTIVSDCSRIIVKLNTRMELKKKKG